MHLPGPVFTCPKVWSLTSRIPSTDHRQLSGLFPSFSLRLLWRLQKYISTFFILRAISLWENRQWSESWESMGNNSLTTSSSTWQTEDYFFNEKFYLKTLNPKKTQWKHLLDISNRYFIDESLWNHYSQRFQNKPATARVPPATWLYVAGYSGHNSLLKTNNLAVASYLKDRKVTSHSLLQQYIHKKM